MKKISMNPLQLGNLFLMIFLIGVAISPFAGTCSSSNKVVNADSDNPLLKSDSVQAGIAVQSALREIYKEVNPAVVRIETEQTVKVVNPFFNDPFFRRHFGTPDQQSQKRQGLGSGFIISKDGYIVTNEHVVRNVDKITVKLVNGKEYEAKIIGIDNTSDIAMLKIDGAKNLKVVHLGDSDEVEVGDFAIAIGNPFGFSSTFTFGVVSSKGQDLNTEDGVQRIQTDVAINPGNSGGPLLNVKGEVIGINQMIASRSGGSEGIGFAIPINYAKEVFEQLKDGKEVKRGYIGVSIRSEPPEDLLNDLGLKNKKGLLVEGVAPSSPAWKAGIRQYDFITKVDGKEADAFNDLKSTVIRKGPGKVIDLTVLKERTKETAVVKVRIEEIPDNLR